MFVAAITLVNDEIVLYVIVAANFCKPWSHDYKFQLLFVAIYCDFLVIAAVCSTYV